MNQFSSVREGTARAERVRLASLASDLIALTKPRVTGLVMATAAVGLELAPGRIAVPRALSMLLTTALLVGAANALNCWLERDSDAFMRRTRERPLPARRLDPQIGFVFGAVLGVASLPLLAVVVNPLTGLLGAVALFSYVWLYTPLKFKSPHAMIVGAVPGALPPLMGWTAVTGTFGAGGLALFAIVFVWQMPHVIGLSIYRRSEYAAAGIRVLPLVHGTRVSQYHAIGWALLMLPVSLLPAWLGLGGTLYMVAALLASSVYLGSTLLALVRPDENVDRWGRRVFFVSLLYLPLLLCALLIDQGF
jgi:protoheme IX farnesyltransferase